MMVMIQDLCSQETAPSCVVTPVPHSDVSRLTRDNITLHLVLKHALEMTKYLKNYFKIKRKIHKIYISAFNSLPCANITLNFV